MKRLRELNFITTKPGASGEFHYVLLLNPNAAMEWLRKNNQVQDELYGRFIDRAADVGAMGDLEQIRTFFAAQLAQQAAVAAQPASPVEASAVAGTTQSPDSSVTA